MSQRYLGGIITANPTAPTLSSASGVWTLEQQFQYSQTIQPEIIGNSLRFRSSASAYMNRTPISSGNTTKFTFSYWFKRGTISAQQVMFGINSASTNIFTLSFLSDNTFRVFDRNAGSDVLNLTTTAVYRDPSAWYHIVVAIDTTQATSANRALVYINGIQVTAFGTATYPSQNTALVWNNNSYAHEIGRESTGNYLDGYMAEAYFVDGQQLTPSSFGAFDSTGVWQPLPYTGTFGTNGFYLNFSDNSAATAAAIGKDYSGNGNNWTPNNISVTSGVTYDSMLDVPTPWADGGNGRGNYCVANPIFPLSQAQTYSNANLQVSGTYGLSIATIAVSSGKFYCEAVYSALGASGLVGVQSLNQIAAGGTPVRSTGSVGYWSYGSKIVDNVDSAYGATWTTNDVIGIAVDFDNNQITFYKNNVSQGTISYTFSNYSNWTFGSGSGGAVATNTIIWNFGQRPFTYTPPTGFKALNTLNLSSPTIMNGAQYMAATTYTGNGSTQTITNGGNNTIGTTFKPDFVWVKGRSGATSHNLSDSVRGTASTLFSNTTGAENGSSARINAFNSNGFSVGNDADVNTNTATYVGWQWQAGAGTTSSNTSGTITSTVCAGATQGFSVVTYSGTGVNATVGHGLGVAPSMIIAKHRNAIDNWIVYHTSLGGSPDYLWLNLTSAKGTSSAVWNTAPTSSVFGVGTDNLTNLSGGTYVAYCWAAVPGFSAFGSYTGNGSADGPFVYCGFRPRWVMVKKTSATSNWTILDTARDTYNASAQDLLPNSSAVESTATSISGAYADILSNGFKARGNSGDINDSGATYIYAAFAENPFKIARAR